MRTSWEKMPSRRSWKETAVSTVLVGRSQEVRASATAELLVETEPTLQKARATRLHAVLRSERPPGRLTGPGGRSAGSRRHPADETRCAAALAHSRYRAGRLRQPGISGAPRRGYRRPDEPVQPCASPWSQRWPSGASIAAACWAAQAMNTSAFAGVQGASVSQIFPEADEHAYFDALPAGDLILTLHAAVQESFSRIRERTHA
jgi:hypothetical protein